MTQRTTPLLAALGVLVAALAIQDFAPRERSPSERALPRAAERPLPTRTAARLTRLSSPDLGPPPIRAAATPAGAQAPYIEGQVLVAPAAGERLEVIAADYGAAVIRQPRHSGYGVLEGEPSLLAALRADDRIADVAPHGLVLGAAGKGQGKNQGSDTGSASTIPESVQWHLGAANVPSTPEGDLSSVVVAVLDTGVAYEDYTDEGGTYAAAPGLVGTPIVAPWDFVNGDSHANDDNQHGTHIASTILSSGELRGVAPGAALMPVKVLDQQNSGYELDLIDGIYWAVDSGADIINLSLSFGKGYVPSRALLDALDAAHDAGLVLIGASGNEGVAEVTWPAASPQVLAVAASCKSAELNYEAAGYSNLGTMVDVMAPGGCLDRDENDDGVLDGIAAETIDPDDPTIIAPWLMAGTSQAAAVTSGAAALLLAAGASSADISWLLQFHSMDSLGMDGITHGLGSSFIDIAGAVEDANYSYEYLNGYAFYVAVLPWLADNGDGTVSPKARVTVLDEALSEARKITVLARLHGDTTDWLSCSISKGGVCELTGPAADAMSGNAALAWRFSIDGVVVQNSVIFRPGRLLFASGELEELADVLSDDSALREAMLALRWEAGVDDELGAVAEAYSVMDSGSGLASSPLGLLFTPAVISGAETSDVDLSGTGLASSPLGLQLLQLDSLAAGTGLASSPLGFSLLSVSAFNGTGLASSPLGRATFSTLEGSGLASSPLGLAPMLMEQGIIGASVDTSDTALQQLLDEGAWSTGDGLQAASALSGGEVIETSAAPVGSGSGSGAMPL